MSPISSHLTLLHFRIVVERSLDDDGGIRTHGHLSQVSRSISSVICAIETFRYLRTCIHPLCHIVTKSFAADWPLMVFPAIREIIRQEFLLEATRFNRNQRSDSLTLPDSYLQCYLSDRSCVYERTKAGWLHVARSGYAPLTQETRRTGTRPWECSSMHLSPVYILPPQDWIGRTLY